MPTSIMGTVFTILAIVLLLVSVAAGGIGILKQKMSDPFFGYRNMMPPGMRMRPTKIPLVPLLIFVAGGVCLLIAIRVQSQEAMVKVGQQSQVMTKQAPPNGQNQ